MAVFFFWNRYSLRHFGNNGRNRGNPESPAHLFSIRQIGLSDALRALEISMGIETYDLARGDDKLDVGPFVDGKPQPDGVVDIGDAVVLLRKTVGLVIW